MTEQEADRKQAIEALLAERKKFEAWLTQLEAKRASASSHVFDRVFADYSKRLDDVRTRLLDEADTLKSIVGDLETRLGKEQDKVTKKTDERAEAELRAMVGEYSEKEWTTTKAKLDASISDLRAKFDATERELADLKELLASVTGAPAPARASVMIAAEAMVAAALDDAKTADAAEEPKPAAEEPTAEPPVAASPVPEPEAAKLVETPKAEVKEVEPPKPESKVVAPPKAEPKASESKAGSKDAKPASEPKPTDPPPRKSTPFDELAFLRSVAGTPSRPSGTAAVSAAPPVVPTMPEPPLIAEPEPAQASEPEAVAEPETPRTRTSSSAKVESDSPLGAPTPRTSQAIRSLKCQECGTLNFPTEWYCERCGGELAAF